MYDAELSQAMAGRYEITHVGHLLHVVLSGNWDLALEIKYLTELASAIDAVRHNPWGMLVDMREWKLPSVTDESIKENLANVHISRGNQRCECWIVRDEAQASQLQPFVENTPGMSFCRVSSPQQAEEFLTSKGFELN